MPASEGHEPWWRRPVLTPVLRSRWLCVTVLAVVFFQLVRVWFQVPDAGCFFYNVTSWPCPGCGLSRAFLLLLRGDIVGAFHMHALVLPLSCMGALFVAGACLTGAWRRAFLNRVAALERKTGLAVLVGAGVALYGCARLIGALVEA